MMSAAVQSTTGHWFVCVRSLQAAKSALDQRQVSFAVASSAHCAETKGGQQVAGARSLAQQVDNSRSVDLDGALERSVAAVAAMPTKPSSRRSCTITGCRLCNTAR